MPERVEQVDATRDGGVLSRKAGAARSQSRHVASPLPAQLWRRSRRPACPKLLATSDAIWNPGKRHLQGVACARTADPLMLHLNGELPHLAKQHSANAMLATVTVVGRNGMASRAAVDSRRATCACPHVSAETRVLYGEEWQDSQLNACPHQ